jgi:bacillithiol system protein YtxJ
MENHFIKITDTKSLEELAVRSKEQPVVIFKHSLTFPISARAYAESRRQKAESYRWGRLELALASEANA